MMTKQSQAPKFNPDRVTLAELVVLIPAAGRVLRSHKLDYCCRGHLTLAQACTEADLSPGAVLEEVNAQDIGEAAPIRWQERPLGDVVDHLLGEHEQLRAAAQDIAPLAAKVDRVHLEKNSPGWPVELLSHFAVIQRSLLAHLDKEEKVLFPAVMAKNGWVDTSVALLQRDHEELGAALARTRRLTLDFSPPPGACPSWRELYEELALLEGQLMDHVHLENNNLFPRMLYR